MKRTYTKLLTLSSIFIEWFEFAIFIYSIPLLSKLFFPTDSRINPTFLTYGILAASYLMRPVGAMIYGYKADKVGRKSVMLLSVLVMSISTFALGILPIYATIGMLAPILLLLFRMFQSFAIGIEFNNVGSFFIEHAKNKVVSASLLCSTVASGMCIGAYTVSSMNLTLYPWVWRAPFIVSACLSFLIFVLRQQLEESPEFMTVKNANQLSENPFKEVLKTHKKELFLIAALAAYIGVFLYTGKVYLISYLVKYGKYQLNYATKLASLGELLIAVLAPTFAIIGYKKNLYKTFFKTSTVLLATTGFLLFYVGAQGPGSSHYMRVIFISYIISDCLFSSAIFYYIYLLLPARLRCTGTGLAYSFPIALFGGTSPLLAEIFVSRGMIYMPGIYIALMSMGILFCTIYITKREEFFLARINN